MQYSLIRKFRTLALVCLFSSLAGVIFQLINEGRLDYNSVLVGLPMGLVFSLLELFLFPMAGHQFRKWSFTRLIVFKTILYTTTIYAMAVFLTITAGWLQGQKWNELPAYLTSVDLMILVIYTLAIYSLLVFLLQINHLLGAR